MAHMRPAVGTQLQVEKSSLYRTQLLTMACSCCRGIWWRASSGPVAIGLLFGSCLWLCCPGRSLERSSGTLWASPGFSSAASKPRNRHGAEGIALGFCSHAGPLPVWGLPVLSACSDTNLSKAWGRPVDLLNLCMETVGLTWMLAVPTLGFAVAILPGPGGFQLLEKGRLPPRCICGPRSRGGSSVD